MISRNLLASAGILVLFAAPAVAEEAPDARVVRGEALYHQHCGACHGVEADGNGALATVLDPRPPDLRMIAARRDGVFPEVEIQRIIDGRDPRAAHGAREMPVWGRRFHEGHAGDPAGDVSARGAIQLIVAFLKSVQLPAGEAAAAE